VSVKGAKEKVGGRGRVGRGEKRQQGRKGNPDRPLFPAEKSPTAQHTKKKRDWREGLKKTDTQTGENNGSDGGEGY